MASNQDCTSSSEPDRMIIDLEYCSESTGNDGATSTAGETDSQCSPVKRPLISDPVKPGDHSSEAAGHSSEAAGHPSEAVGHPPTHPADDLDSLDDIFHSSERSDNEENMIRGNDNGGGGCGNDSVYEENSAVNTPDHEDGRRAEDGSNAHCEPVTQEKVENGDQEAAEKSGDAGECGLGDEAPLTSSQGSSMLLELSDTFLDNLNPQDSGSCDEGHKEAEEENTETEEGEIGNDTETYVSQRPSSPDYSSQFEVSDTFLDNLNPQDDSQDSGESQKENEITENNQTLAETKDDSQEQKNLSMEESSPCVNLNEDSPSSVAASPERIKEDNENDKEMPDESEDNQAVGEVNNDHLCSQELQGSTVKDQDILGFEAALSEVQEDANNTEDAPLQHSLASGENVTANETCTQNDVTKEEVSPSEKLEGCQEIESGSPERQEDDNIDVASKENITADETHSPPGPNLVEVSLQLPPDEVCSALPPFMDDISSPQTPTVDEAPFSHVRSSDANDAGNHPEDNMEQQDVTSASPITHNTLTDLPSSSHEQNPGSAASHQDLPAVEALFDALDKVSDEASTPLLDEICSLHSQDLTTSNASSPRPQDTCENDTSSFMQEATVSEASCCLPTEGVPSPCAQNRSEGETSCEEGEICPDHGLKANVFKDGSSAQPSILACDRKNEPVGAVSLPHIEQHFTLGQHSQRNPGSSDIGAVFIPSRPSESVAKGDSLKENSHDASLWGVQEEIPVRHGHDRNTSQQERFEEERREEGEYTSNPTSPSEPGDYQERDSSDRLHVSTDDLDISCAADDHREKSDGEHCRDRGRKERVIRSSDTHPRLPPSVVEDSGGDSDSHVLDLNTDEEGVENPRERLSKKSKGRMEEEEKDDLTSDEDGAGVIDTSVNMENSNAAGVTQNDSSSKDGCAQDVTLVSTDNEDKGVTEGEGQAAPVVNKDSDDDDVQIIEVPSPEPIDTLIVDDDDDDYIVPAEPNSRTPASPDSYTSKRKKTSDRGGHDLRQVIEERREREENDRRRRRHERERRDERRSDSHRRSESDRKSSERSSRRRHHSRERRRKRSRSRSRSRDHSSRRRRHRDRSRDRSSDRERSSHRKRRRERSRERFRRSRSKSRSQKRSREDSWDKENRDEHDSAKKRRHRRQDSPSRSQDKERSRRKSDHSSVAQNSREGRRGRFLKDPSDTPSPAHSQADKSDDSSDDGEGSVANEQQDTRRSDTTEKQPEKAVHVPEKVVPAPEKVVPVPEKVVPVPEKVVPVPEKVVPVPEKVVPAEPVVVHTVETKDIPIPQPRYLPVPEIVNIPVPPPLFIPVPPPPPPPFLPQPIPVPEPIPIMAEFEPLFHRPPMPPLPPVPPEEPQENPPEPPPLPLRWPEALPVKGEGLLPTPIRRKAALEEPTIYDPAHPTDDEAERILFTGMPPNSGHPPPELLSGPPPPQLPGQPYVGPPPVEGGLMGPPQGVPMQSFSPHQPMLVNRVPLPRPPFNNGPFPPGPPPVPQFRMEVGAQGEVLQLQGPPPGHPPNFPGEINDRFEDGPPGPPGPPMRPFPPSVPPGHPEMPSMPPMSGPPPSDMHMMSHPPPDLPVQDGQFSEERFDQALTKLVVVQNLLSSVADLKADRDAGPLPAASVFKAPMPPSGHATESPDRIQGSSESPPPVVDLSEDSTEVMDMDMSPADEECQLLPSSSKTDEGDDKEEKAKPLAAIDLRAISNAIMKLTSLPAEDAPTSAVDLTNKERVRYMKKLHLQERVVDEVKQALRPFYSNKKINKEEYKTILRKAVPKVCHSKSGDIDPQKILLLVEGYVNKFQKQREYTEQKVKPAKTAAPSKDNAKANGEHVNPAR